MNFPLSKDHKNNDVEREEVFKELTDYQIYSEHQKTKNAFRFQMLVKKSKTILQYWQVDGKRWPNLQKLAMKVYSMAASSASAERNFSTFGFVHSKLWNQIDPETVKKLVFIKSNSSQFEDHVFHDDVQDSSDTDDDKE